MALPAYALDFQNSTALPFSSSSFFVSPSTCAIRVHPGAVLEPASNAVLTWEATSENGDVTGWAKYTTPPRGSRRMPGEGVTFGVGIKHSQTQEPAIEFYTQHIGAAPSQWEKLETAVLCIDLGRRGETAGDKHEPSGYEVHIERVEGIASVLGLRIEIVSAHD